MIEDLLNDKRTYMSYQIPSDVCIPWSYNNEIMDVSHFVINNVRARCYALINNYKQILI